MKAKCANGSKVRVRDANQHAMFSNPKIQGFHGLSGEIVSSGEVVGYLIQESADAVAPGELSIRTIFPYDVRLDEEITIEDVTEYYFAPFE